MTARRGAEWPCRSILAPSDARSPQAAWDRIGSVLPGAVGLSLAAALLVCRGHLRLPLLLSAAAASLLLLGLVAPQVGRGLEEVTTRASHAVGRVLTASLLGALWLVVLLPVALLNRALGLDLLEGCHTAGEWRPRPDTERARSDRRPFGAEPRIGGLAVRRVARAVVPVVMVAVLAIPLYHRVTTRQVAEADYNQFGLRAVAPPSRPVAEDRWFVTSEGVAVSETVFPGEPWGASVLGEQRQISMFHPRYGWANADTSGRFVNVVNGHRVTFSIQDPEMTVWLFGGSTVFGIGQRDRHTIASGLVREAARTGRRLRVVNYGVAGYVNWQETQVFANELQARPAPDVAVFLDGANEVGLAFEREVYGLLDASKPLALSVDDATRRERLADAQARGWEEHHDPRRQERLAAEQYGAGVRWARSLGVRHDLPVVHFWQPTLATMPTHRPGVATVYHNLDLDPSWGSQQELMIDGVAKRSGVEPIDLTDLFDDIDQPVFFDWAHCNEFGARVQASAIWEHLEPVIAGIDDRRDQQVSSTKRRFPRVPAMTDFPSSR